MVSLKVIASALVMMSLTSPCSQAQLKKPRSVLKGTVVDKTTKATIGGARIQVLNAAGVVRGATITGQDGTYLVTGLVFGESVNAVYSATGYAPDPWSRPLRISKREIVQDVALLCDCNDAAYWKTWADNEKAVAETVSHDPSVRARLLNDAWSALGKIGVSAEARGAAASNLIAVEPATGKFGPIVGFANTDPMVLRKTEGLLRVTLNGGIVEDLPTVSPQITAEIAAVEVRKRSKAEGKDISLVLGKLDSAWSKQTAQYTKVILDKDEPETSILHHGIATKRK